MDYNGQETNLPAIHELTDSELDGVTGGSLGTAVMTGVYAAINKSAGELDHQWRLANFVNSIAGP